MQKTHISIRVIQKYVPICIVSDIQTKSLNIRNNDKEVVSLLSKTTMDINISPRTQVT